MRWIGLLLFAIALSLPTSARAQDENPIILAITNGAGRPGEVVEIQLLVHRDVAIQGDPTRLSGIDLTLSWNPSVAFLVSVSTTDVTLGWQLASRIDDGQAEVSMASIDPVSATPVGLRMLDFRFQLLPFSGDTPLVLSETRAFDLDQEPILHVVQNGDLSSSLVPVEFLGVGRWKAGY